MIQKLKELNFRVTLWIHPFISCKSFQFIKYWYHGLLINFNLFSSLFHFILEQNNFLREIFDDLLTNTQYEFLINSIKSIYQKCSFSLPGITVWWNGLAGILDLTNPLTQNEYTLNLENLQKSYDIDSFKFDAGEINWLPKFSSLKNSSSQQMTIDKTTLITTPAIYTYLYAQLAHRIDKTNRLQEVRIGYRTQTLPMFVRIIDKDSKWTYDNGLRSLLPSIFNLTLLGYPFILPDMVRFTFYFHLYTRVN